MHKLRNILCIIPPHMLREIGEKGTANQRTLALATLSHSNEIRSLRFQKEMVERAAMMRAPTKQRNVYDAKNGSQLPGTLVRTEGDPISTDTAVK